MVLPGSDNEVDFWRRFVKSDRCAMWLDNSPNPELGTFITDFITTNTPKDGKILDCGSGVISILYGLGFNLTTTDVLAHEYIKLLPTNPAPPLAIGVEDLTYENEFDIVHMRNALDHCQDPIKAYNAMYAAVKPGGFLIIHGFENEATAENWKGMHQWDIMEQYGVLIIHGKNNKTLKNNPYFSNTETLHNGKKWLTWIVKK